MKATFVVPSTWSNSRSSSRNVAVAEVVPVRRLEDPRQPVAVHRLDHCAPARPQHAAKLAERLEVALVAPVADRGEEVEHEVEARVLERELAVVALDERQLRARPRGVAPRRAGRASGRERDAEARAGERDSVAAVARGGVQHVGRRPEPDADTSCSISSSPEPSA